jgi:hypothetical protein
MQITHVPFTFIMILDKCVFLQLHVASHETFHKEAEKNYWQDIAKLIP